MTQLAARSDTADTESWDASTTNARRAATDHARRVALLVLETFGGTAALFTAAWLALRAGAPVVAWLLAIPRGLWIQRHYCVGHEAAHGKLVPGRPLANDLLGQASLLALLTPLPVFRKIHRFHHGHNRRDLHTSALDVVWIGSASWWRRLVACGQWLVAVFGCGWFLHGLASIVLFLGLPLSVAERVSVAFRGWTLRERLLSIGAFAVGVALHVGCLWPLGPSAWVPLVVAPLMVFSWSYSAQLYIYHYDTSIGPQVTRHARSLGGPIVSWWLMNLNEHANHHQRPALVWYALGAAAKEDRPPPGVVRSARRSFAWGVLNQLRGPRIVVRGRPR